LGHGGSSRIRWKPVEGMGAVERVGTGREHRVKVDWGGMWKVSCGEDVVVERERCCGVLGDGLVWVSEGHGSHGVALESL
jgi:hypothetical protein